VLKYDEVMNEQRKVIYRRRDQILEGGDLRDTALEALSESIDGLVRAHAAADYAEEWDLDGLLNEVHNYWPTNLGRDELQHVTTSDALYELLMADAQALYERREQELTPDLLRQVERQVMLRIIDTRWREHLQEMDYLREGIHLRAMGQKDPAVEWQREGFEMFGQMISGVNDDFVRYITHVQVSFEEAPAPADELRNVQYSAAEEPVQGSAGMAAIAAAGDDGRGLAPAEPDEPAIQQPVVKSDLEKTPRNAPCPCGSGKKFKLCHGR
jgi:preprotein translocase subunit SecA